MAVEAIISVVIQKLSDFLNEESEIFIKVSVDINKVVEKLREMQNILSNAQYQEQTSTVLQSQDIVYGIEDTIESFFSVETRLKRMGFVKKHFSVIAKSCGKVPPETMYHSQNVLRLKSKMDEFSDKIQEWKSGIPSLAVLQQHEPPRLEHDNADYLPIFEKYFGTLLKQLIDSKENSLQKISVFGEIGIGKAVLVNKICNKSKVKSKFTCRADLQIRDTNRSVRHHILDILQQVISSCKEKEKETLDVFLKGVEELKDESLIGRLRGFLKNKTYLIVINHVKSLDLLGKLLSVLPDTKNGSSVVITTSDEETASSFADETSRYHYKPLGVNDVLKVFFEKVQDLVKESPLPGDIMKESLKNKIAGICRGNPLRISLLAGYLSMKKIYEDWSSIDKQLDFATISPSFDIVAFSYNDLPPHLKPCFLYIGLFQKGFEIPVRRLFRLWIAEGFVKPSEKGIILEDTVEGYLKELVQRNMVEITKKRSDECPIKCRMVESLHDIFRPKAVEIGLFHLHQNSQKESNEAAQHRLQVRRVVEYTNIKYYPVSEDSNHSLQSYISLNNRKKDKGADDVGNYLTGIIEARGFGLLKVLDLEGVDQPRLPNNLGNLCHLRYLGLRCTFLSALPSSVGSLIQLQTLDIKHTQITSVPSSIWNMKHLRHLCLNGARLGIPVKSTKHTAPNHLQVLQGLFVDDKTAGKIGSTLKKMTELRKLDLTSESTSTSDPSSYKGISLWISSLSSLQSLRLRSTNRMGQPSELNIIKDLSSLKNLSELYLLGHLPNSLDRYKIPSGLKVLTLSVSQLQEDPMPTLSELKSLIDLRLLAASYKGEKMHVPANGFPALRVLKLWKLENLEILTLCEGAMQKLHTLEIRCCVKLIEKEVPETLLTIDEFRKLILTNMPKPFVTEMKRRKKKHYDIEVILNEKDL